MVFRANRSFLGVNEQFTLEKERMAPVALLKRGMGANRLPLCNCSQFDLGCTHAFASRRLGLKDNVFKERDYSSNKQQEG